MEQIWNLKKEMVTKFLISTRVVVVQVGISGYPANLSIKSIRNGLQLFEPYVEF